jgi:hypothetical protein
MFKVTKVMRGQWNVYELEDLEGKPIIFKFYEEDISCWQEKRRVKGWQGDEKEKRWGERKWFLSRKEIGSDMTVNTINQSNNIFKECWLEPMSLQEKPRG